MIGIYGDSFADMNPKELIDEALDRMPWPKHLENMLGKKVTTHALAATSPWWSYKKFLKHIKITTLSYSAILTMTDGIMFRTKIKQKLD